MSRVGCPSIWFAEQAWAFIKIAKEGSYTAMEEDGISLESFNINFCPVTRDISRTQLWNEQSDA